MPFVTRLAVTEAATAGRWELLEDLVYRGRAHLIVARAGFVTDFNSVPRPLWPLFPPTSADSTKAAVLHDMLYSTLLLSRRDADGVYRRAMKELGAPPWRRWVMWGAVRAFGWRRYGAQGATPPAPSFVEGDVRSL